jgi:hypothetical protein
VFHAVLCIAPPIPFDKSSGRFVYIISRRVCEKKFPTMFCTSLRLYFDLGFLLATQFSKNAILFL